MRLGRLALTLLLPVLLCKGGYGAEATPRDEAVAALLDRARLWESRERYTQARETLDKLFHVAPDNPDGLALLGQVEIRAGQPVQAKAALERLRRAQPGHPGIARLENQLRIVGGDQDKLTAARNLARQVRTGHRELLPQALAAYKSLFGNTPPEGELALEYWQLFSASDNSWEQVHSALRQLSRQNPDNLRYRYALAEHETTRLPLNRKALNVIIEMTRSPIFQQQARAAWRRAMLRQDATPEGLAALDEYLEKDPGDGAVKELRQRLATTLEAQRRLLADPDYRAKLEGLALLDGNDLERAEAALRQAVEGRPQDADGWGGLGMVRLRQGRHAEAEACFRKARSLDAANAAKWDGLTRTARFWGLLQAANEALDAGELGVAEDKLTSAHQLDNKQISLLLAWARLRQQQGRDADAEGLYRQALALAPANASALSGMLNFYVAADRRAEADRMVAALTPAQRKALGSTLAEFQAGLLRRDADKLGAAGQLSEAMDRLQQALALDGNDPWLVYDVARLHARQGDPDRGEQEFDDFLRRHPGQAAALYARALFQSGAERERMALDSLERIHHDQRNASMASLQRRLWQRVQVDWAETLFKTGYRQDARQVLAQVETVVSNLEQAIPVAYAWRTLGDAARGRGLLSRFVSSRTPPAQRLNYAEFLFRSGDEEEMARQLEVLVTSPDLDAATSRNLALLQEEYQVARARRLLELGRQAEARAVLTESRAEAHSRNWYLMQGRVAAALADHAAAEAAYRQVLTSAPDNEDAWEGLIDSLVASGRAALALAEIHRGLDSHPTPQTRVVLAGLLQQQGQLDEALALIRQLRDELPEEPRLLALAGQVAYRQGYYDEAVDLLGRAIAAEQMARQSGPALRLSRLSVVSDERDEHDERDERGGGDDTSPVQLVLARPGPLELENSGRYKQRAELLDMTTPGFSGAVDIRNRAGNEGLSQLESVEIPLEYRSAWDGDRQQVWRADLARLDAGNLDLARQRDARDFGSVLLCQTGLNPCTTGSLSQTARGASLNWGQQGADWRMDIGTTPLGFPVTNLIGGWLQKGDLGPLSYSVDISRRPVTGSLLSFAGARDPRTGTVWGGVVASGVRFGLSKDEGGAFGAWGSLGIHRLTGQNVQDNNRLQVMAGAYWRIINDENRLLTLGLTAMNWRFAKNAGEYTFGHGGYYSPQDYHSLALPLTYGERYTRFSWMVRAAMSVSAARFDAAPYFPTDSGMQAAAEGLGSGFDPHYSASGSRGHGYSLHGAWEYQVDRETIIGSRLEIERSDSYTPNRFLFYWRTQFDEPLARPVLLPPEAILPTSQY